MCHQMYLKNLKNKKRLKFKLKMTKNEKFTFDKYLELC